MRGVEDCALPPEAIREAFFRAASGIWARVVTAEHDEEDSKCLRAEDPQTCREKGSSFLVQEEWGKGDVATLAVAAAVGKIEIGLRWRTEKEVVSGKGQFVCGNRECNENDSLASYEVNFSYTEAGESKQALVKLVACKRCTEKLVYRRLKEKEQEQAKAREQAKANDKIHLKRKREMDGHENSTDDECDRKDARKKGHGASSSTTRKTGDDESFEEFLEGMFP